MTRAETARDRLPRFALLAGGWLGLRARGVEVDARSELTLSRIPDAGVPVGPAVAFDPRGPGGLAVGTDGFGFVCDPVRAKVLRFDECAPLESAPGLLGIAAVDAEFCPGRFLTPRGLAIGPRRRLYVADAGADAVIVVDLLTGATTGSWPAVGPWQVVADEQRLLVLDRSGPAGSGRIRALDADGTEDSSFAPDSLLDPFRVAPIRVAPGAASLVVLDRGPAADRVVVVDGATGAELVAWTPVRGDPLIPGSLVDVARVAGLAVLGERVHLVDAAQGDLLTFTIGGDLVGIGRAATELADLLWAGGALWGEPVAGGPWLRHDPVGRSLTAGAFVCGPIDTATETGRRELRARLTRSPGQHVRLWTAVVRGGVVPDPATLPLGADPSPGWVGWAALPADVEAALLPQPSGPLVCIGGELSGDGASSPRVGQLAVGGGGGWLDLLPAVYRKDADRADFLDRLLRLLQSLASETDAERRDLAARFDAWAAADDGGGSGALDDLAGWLAVGLDERWDEQRRRRTVAGAHAAQAVRGTALGLGDAIQERFGTRPVITSPAQRATVWSLGPDESECGCVGQPSGLGFSTMLAAAPPEGAVVGTSAAVNGSHLLGGERAGAPLFADLAHRFHVQLLAASVAGGGGEAALRALIDAERPAHTAYTLCLIGPDARVGVQSRVGVDLIVGGPPPAWTIGTPTGLGHSALTGLQARVGKEHIA